MAPLWCRLPRYVYVVSVESLGLAKQMGVTGVVSVRSSALVQIDGSHQRGQCAEQCLGTDGGHQCANYVRGN